jgi:hypothetical protein
LENARTTADVKINAPAAVAAIVRRRRLRAIAARLAATRAFVKDGRSLDFTVETANEAGRLAFFPLFLPT